MKQTIHTNQLSDQQSSTMKEKELAELRQRIAEIEAQQTTATPMKLLSISQVASELKRNGHQGFNRRFIASLKADGLPMFNGRTTPETVLNFVQSKLNPEIQSALGVKVNTRRSVI